MGNCLSCPNENEYLILELPTLVLEMICSFLDRKDLTSLSNTCNPFYSIVSEFMKHCSAKLMSTNQRYLTLPTQFEQHLVNSMKTDMVVDRHHVFILYKLLVESQLTEWVSKLTSSLQTWQKLWCWTACWAGRCRCWGVGRIRSSYLSSSFIRLDLGFTILLSG